MHIILNLILLVNVQKLSYILLPLSHAVLFNENVIRFKYCRTHNVSVCLYIAYITCGSASLYIKTLYFFLTVLALSAGASVANIKIRYDAKISQFALFGTRVIYVFYSTSIVLYENRSQCCVLSVYSVTMQLCKSSGSLLNVLVLFLES